MSNGFIPLGTVLRVRLCHAIDLDKGRPENPFIASLSAPVCVQNEPILPKGTVARGTVYRTVSPGHASIRFVLEVLQWEREELAIRTNGFVWHGADLRTFSTGAMAGAGLAGTSLIDVPVRIPVQATLIFRLEEAIVLPSAAEYRELLQ